MRSLIAFLFLASTAHADFNPKYTRYAASVGVLRSGAVSSTSSEVLHLKFTPTESGNKSWYEWFSNTVNTPGPRGDHVRIAGWNVTSGGGALDTTDGANFDS